MSRTCIAIIALAGLSNLADARPARAQSGCPAEDPGVTSCVQGVLDGSLHGESREVLGLSHLRGQSALPLQPTTHDVACDAIFAGLPDNVQTGMSEDARYHLLYYAVGDRYLLVFTPRPDVQQLLPTTIISFDQQFDIIDAVVWT